MDRKRLIRRLNEVTPPEHRVNPQEWDFSYVPRAEQTACCYYEFARESTYIMETLKNELPSDDSDPRLEKLRQSPLPPRNDYDCCWQLKEPKWRAQFCEQLAERLDALSYARSLERTPSRAFDAGIALHIDPALWDDVIDKGSALDVDSGLEALVVTINWSNFADRELVSAFKEWIKENRPKAIGVHSKKGKKSSIWRMHLKKLSILRLRHNYSSEEVSRMSLPGDLRTKFDDQSEVNRCCRWARTALQSLYPFLPDGELPRSWHPFNSARSHRS